MRIFRDEVLRRRQVDALQELVHRRERLPSRAGLLVAEERRREGLKYGARRVERRVRVLMDELHSLAEACQVSAFRLPDVLALVEKPATGGPKQPREEPSGRGLAAATLPDGARRLPGVERG